MFCVPFQKWLKTHAGRTYGEAIIAYSQIVEEKKNKTPIDKQFEYNTYIRDFFEDNQGKTLEQAIMCWKYKRVCKAITGTKKQDLTALQAENNPSLQSVGLKSYPMTYDDAKRFKKRGIIMSYVTGNVIKELREKKGYTQKQLADRLGVSDKTISKWETGKGLPMWVLFQIWLHL